LCFRGGAYLEKYVDDLLPNGLYKFRTRAVTRIAPGKWTDWEQIRTGQDIWFVLCTYYGGVPLTTITELTINVR